MRFICGPIFRRREFKSAAALPIARSIRSRGLAWRSVHSSFSRVFRIALIVEAFAGRLRRPRCTRATERNPCRGPDKGFPRAFHRRFLRWFAGYLRSSTPQAPELRRSFLRRRTRRRSPTPNIRSAAHRRSAIATSNRLSADEGAIRRTGQSMVEGFAVFYFRLGRNKAPTAVRLGISRVLAAINAAYLYDQQPNSINLHQFDLHAIQVGRHLPD